jgi:hypothetical protein
VRAFPLICLVAFGVMDGGKDAPNSRRDSIASIEDPEFSSSVPFEDVLISDFSKQVEGRSSRDNGGIFLGRECPRKGNGAEHNFSPRPQIAFGSSPFQDWERGSGKRRHHELAASFDIERRGIAGVLEHHPPFKSKPSPKVAYFRSINDDICTRLICAYGDGACLFVANYMMPLEARPEHDEDRSGNHCPKTNQFVARPPIDGRANADDYGCKSQRPDDRSFHAFSLHDVMFTAFVSALASFIIGGLLGAVFSPLRR